MTETGVDVIVGMVRRYRFIYITDCCDGDVRCDILYSRHQESSSAPLRDTHPPSVLRSNDNVSWD
jgi:hypothetical protein